MPHEQPWINDTLKRHEAELQDQFELQEKKFAVINAAIKARLDAECNSNDCNGCGNAECVAAHKEYLKLWPENAAELIEQEKEPVSQLFAPQAPTHPPRFYRRLRNSGTLTNKNRQSALVSLRVV
ncbi:hypothetical protein MASR1M12_18950 [Erysipelotrichia bacterium]